MPARARADDGDARHHGGRVLAVTGVGADLAEALESAYARHRAHPFRQGCTTGVTSAEGAGVFDAQWHLEPHGYAHAASSQSQSPIARPALTSTRERARCELMKRRRARHLWARGAAGHRRVRRPVRCVGAEGDGRAGAGRFHRWRGHQDQDRRRVGALRHHRPRYRQPLHQRHPGAGRAAALLPGLHRRRPGSIPEMVAAVVGGCAAACRARAARCWAARRPRCPASMRPGEFDLVGTIVGAGRARRHRGWPIHRGRRRAHRAALERACTPTATRWSAAFRRAAI